MDLSNLSIPFISFVTSAAGAAIGAYYIEKAKNRATKEDVAEITKQIESAKQSYTSDVEKLRSELAERSHYGRVQYEREMEVYRKVWPSLARLHDNFALSSES